jgi:uncharacterized membrane protein YdbT with pleckstrin-like domain
MGYVDSNLMQGETVMHRAKLHKIMFFWPSILAIGLCLVGVWLFTQNHENAIYACICFIVAILFLMPAYIIYVSSEFAVTNKRVIVKVGLIRRQTMETLLQRIEAVRIDQTILGRICNYGSITIIGTGGTQEPFDNIADPMGFRRAVQEQSDAKT